MDERGSSERKLLVILISAGCVALILGFLQIFSFIKKPFQAVTINTSLRNSTALSSLTKTDTDNDGLNDYNELYVYQTSPYIADSDSDGTTDSAEVTGGTDPNCAAGTTCSPLAATNTTILTTNVALTNAVPTTGSSFSATDLRQTLLNAGAPQATLDTLSDAELLELYNEVLGTGTSTNTNTATNTNPDVEALKNLTPDQMREFLIQGGADAEALDNVDDETLRAIFLEAINTVSTQ